MIQESVMVDLSDIDIRKRRKTNDLDDIDGEDYVSQVNDILQKLCFYLSL